MKKKQRETNRCVSDAAGERNTTKGGGAQLGRPCYIGHTKAFVSSSNGQHAGGIIEKVTRYVY